MRAIDWLSDQRCDDDDDDDDDDDGVVIAYLEGEGDSPADDLHYSRGLLEGVLWYSAVQYSRIQM